MSENIVQTMSDARAAYLDCVGRGAGIAQAKEAMKNVAFNFYDELLAAVKENASLREEIAALDQALKDADDELRRMGKRKKV